MGLKPGCSADASVAPGWHIHQCESILRTGNSMVTRKIGLLIAVLALPFLAGGAGAQKTAPSCASQAPAMNPFDSTKVASLVGTFDVIMIDTTSLRGSVRQHAGRLVVWLQDSVPKRRATMARRVQERFMVGTFEAALPDSGEMWSKMMSSSTDSPGAFWSDGYLRLGEFGQKNGISLYFKLITENELRGMWTSQAGTAVIVDFTGDREPDEAGYFCARRVK
jgi:hypothetical protein